MKVISPKYNLHLCISVLPCIEDFDAKEKESLAKIYDNLGFSRAEIEDLENSDKSCNLIIYEKIQKNIQDEAERSVEHQKTAEGLYVQSLSRFSEIFSPKNRKNSSLLFAGHEQNIVKATKAVCDILGINIEPVLGKSYDDSISNERFLTTPSHYTYIKISEGCNKNCTYCVIPSVRGRYRSKTIEQIVEEAKKLLDYAEQGVYLQDFDADVFEEITGIKVRI